MSIKSISHLSILLISVLTTLSQIGEVRSRFLGATVQILIPSFAFVYNESENDPLDTFNPQREDNPKCLTFDNKKVAQIDTNGTCVFLFKGQGCSGYSKEFITAGRVPIGPEMEGHHLSIGPCQTWSNGLSVSSTTSTPTPPTTTARTKNVVMAKIVYWRGYRINGGVFMYNDLQESPKCQKLPKFYDGFLINFGTCVNLYRGADCTGQSKMYNGSFLPIWALHPLIRRGDPKGSIGPC